jgi:uncharacterized protein (DUF58 family)
MSALAIIVLLLLLYVWSMAWRRTVPQRIRATVEIGSHSVRHGETFVLTIHVANHARMPAPHLTARIELPREISTLPPPADLDESGADAVALHAARATEELRARRDILAFSISLRGRESATVAFDLYGGARGRAVFQTMHVEMSDGFTRKLFRNVPINGEVIVHPRLLQPDARDSSLANELGPVSTQRKLYATSLDWVDLRPYQPGDPLRDVAWQVSARRGEWISFERSLSVVREVILVANTQTMKDFWMGANPALIEAVYEQTMGIAVKMLRDNVTLSLYSNSVAAREHGRQCVLRTSGGASPRTVNAIGHELGKLSVFATRPIAMTLRHVAENHSQRSEVILISAYEDDEINRALQRLQAAGHRVTVVHIDATGAPTLRHLDAAPTGASKHAHAKAVI